MARSATEPEATPPNGVSVAPGGAAHGDGAQTGWMLPLVVLVVGVFMSILDITIVTVALPTLQNDFGATARDTTWVVTAYSLTEGVVLPVSAWLGHRFGLTRVYNLALLGFAAGSALCGLAWSLNTLVAFRIVQALLGGILPAVTLSILLRIVPRDRLGAALGLYGIGVVVAPAVGPTLGGYLVEYVNWRLIFFINVPVGILGTIAAILVLPTFPGQAGRRFDVLGFLTVATGLFSLLLALQKGEDWGWGSYQILALLLLSAVSLALFVVVELEVDDPMLDLRVFRHGAFSLSLVLIALMMIALFNVAVYVPQFLQQGQGLGAFDAGLVMLGPALVMACMMLPAGLLYDRIGPRVPTVIGIGIAAVAAYLLHGITLDTSRGHIILLLMLQYLGIGLAMMPIFSGGLAVIPPEQSATASTYNNVVQRTTASLGVAVFTAIVTAQQAQQLSGRADLVPAATTPTPHLGPPGTPDWLGVFATYQQTNNRAFAGAISDLFLIMCGLYVVSMLIAFFLRSGPSAPAGAAPPQPATTPGISAINSQVKDGVIEDGLSEHRFVPSEPASSNGSSAREARGSPGGDGGTHPR
ncbi:MAG TPA: DHA2 family efflux MFS transporter permease subunit [Pseudonocardiaceae bacterium]|nr:DHA2 family efflux MFS transporter permease subunit [Pseudonocardiaceae bacterium]